MSTQEKVNISAQVTPNPNTLKFVVDRPIVKEGTFNFTSYEKSKGSFLPEQMFNIHGVVGVMVGSNFVSITKTVSTDWSNIAEPVTAVIQMAFDSGATLVDESAATQHGASTGDSATAQRIKEILDSEIRPAVAMDGGDITFHSYEDGVLTVHMQGACSSCPSSVVTLRMGIENRLREEIPELKEIVQI